MDEKKLEYYQELLDRFLKGKLNAEEQEELKIAAQQDQSLQDELDLYLRAKAEIRVAGEMDLKSKLKDHLQKDVSSTSKKSTIRRWLYPISSAAAVIALVVYFYALNQKSIFDIGKEFESPPSIVLRTNTEDQFVKDWVDAEREYKAQNYQKSLSLLNEKIQGYTEAANHQGKIKIFKAFNHYQLQQYNEAIQTLQQIPPNNPLYEEVQWYLSLNYLQLDEKEKTLELLNQISSNPDHFKSKEAKSLLNTL